MHARQFPAFLPALPRAPTPRPSHTPRARQPRRHAPAMHFPPLKVLNGKGGVAAPPSQPASPSPPSPPASSSAAPDLSAELKKRIQVLYAAHVSPSGVDYRAMKQSPQFAAYAAHTRLLPQLDLSAALPDDAHKIALFVNLYNALTQHAVVVLGAPPAIALFRLGFAMMVGYRVGPHVLSLNDMENGVLRGNRRVSVLPRPFGKNDPRRALSVDTVDPRVHFVLNCAATSCPPVLFLTAENCERSLEIATKGFLKDEGSLQIDGDRVLLSRIFEWYRVDFSKDGSDKGLLEFVAAHGDPEQKEVKEVKRILEENREKVDVGWVEYDWSLNSS